MKKKYRGDGELEAAEKTVARPKDMEIGVICFL
jgi:hypothetical protein